jgi:hypothetical protein
MSLLVHSLLLCFERLEPSAVGVQLRLKNAQNDHIKRIGARPSAPEFRHIITRHRHSPRGAPEHRRLLVASRAESQVTRAVQNLGEIASLPGTEPRPQRAKKYVPAAPVPREMAASSTPQCEYQAVLSHHSRPNRCCAKKRSSRTFRTVSKHVPRIHGGRYWIEPKRFCRLLFG